MADNGSGSEAATKHHNVKELHRVIRDAAKRVINLEAEKAEIQESIREVKAEVKGAGIKLTDFNAVLRIYKLEDQDRSETLDNLRLCFEALLPGEQGSLFPDTAPVVHEVTSEPPAAA